MPEQIFDFSVYEDLSVCLLYPITDEAVGWTKENIDSPSTWFGGAIPVERRFIEGLCHVILDNCFSIEKDGRAMSVSNTNELVLV